MKILTSNKIWLISSLALLFFFTNSDSDSSRYKLDPAKSFIYVNGTSTLHDWKINVEEIQGILHADIRESKILKLDLIQLIISAKSLKSTKKEMNENIYKALKADQFPKIKYDLKHYSIKGNEISVTGDLSIAGNTKTISSTLYYQVIETQIKCKGNLALKMSDFDIKPPEYLLGTVKTGDKIDVQYYFMFTINENIS